RKALPLPPKPDRRISRIRLSSRQPSMGWLRLVFRDVRREHASRAVLLDPLTQLRAAHVPVGESRPSGSPPRRRVQPCGTTSALARWPRPDYQHYLPTSLRSTIVTRFFATTDALTP